MINQIQRLAAFSDQGKGGNPAGVFIDERLPDAATMQSLAREVGYSETAFARPDGEGWRVRYFSPESEVPFCGHATIALGAALAERSGSGLFTLKLNEAVITVEGDVAGGQMSAALQSPPTASQFASADITERALALFGYSQADLDPALPPMWASAGANHLIFALRTREALAAMDYDLNEGRRFMNAEGLITVAFIHAGEPRRFDVRNAFASGGVLEDPATGAAAAALAGALRELQDLEAGSLLLVQGEDMGERSILAVDFQAAAGSSIRVSGTVRHL